MRNEGAGGAGRVPARVLLRGEPGGWHWAVVDDAGAERRSEFAGAGTRWPAGESEPAWWRRRLDETAEGLREAVAERLTDATFRDFGVETRITWFALDDPVEWEGIVTLREADPARFPGRVPPFVVTLEPGRGALLPDANLLFSTRAADAWTTLASVAERCGTRPPKTSFLCGWAGHRSVRVGRGMLSLSTGRGEDGVERLAEICGTRTPGWSGNPEMRFRLDGVDLLDEPAGDVVALLRELDHEIVRRGRSVRLADSGLTLHGPDGPGPAERFTGASLRLPTALAPLWTGS
ncbi:hypothetical protein E1293_27120 [Actinomadura darangshiensis]|uniref:Uncharacterized protein n=1 Tax=Actinomadura darangshiensis TaxID=705336 RepID=A0A4V6PEP5_9ACTN|nr:hypothetical protein [Actinomadura darangshiensis]TDD76507.1 hypothetical protein E1293_27120 [Actinomadura darangshiensis]